MTYATLSQLQSPQTFPSEVYIPTGSDEDEWVIAEAARRGLEPNDENLQNELAEELREYGIIT